MRYQLRRLAQACVRKRSNMPGNGVHEAAQGGLARTFASIPGNGVHEAAQGGLARTFASIPHAQAHRFEGQVAVVTGGAGGIGEATVRRFVSEGARVVIADILDEPGKKLAEELGSAAHFVHTDVTKEADVAAAVDAAFALDGRLDVMFCNAGILGAFGAIDELDMKEYDYTLAVVLKGPVLGLKHAARVMKPAQRGSIVVTASAAAVQAGLGPHSYTVSKSGVVGLAKSAAFELRKHGIRVNAVSPDGVATTLMRHAAKTLKAMQGFDLTLEAAKEAVKSQSFVKGQGLTVEQVAAAVAFLASPEAGYITGHNLVLDGGRSTMEPPSASHEWFQERLPLLREAGIRGLENET